MTSEVAGLKAIAHVTVGRGSKVGQGRECGAKLSDFKWVVGQGC